MDELEIPGTPPMSGKAPVFYPFEDSSDSSSSRSRSPSPVRRSASISESSEMEQPRSFRRSPTPMRQHEEVVQPANFPISLFLIVALCTAGFMTTQKNIQLPEYPINHVSFLMNSIWANILFAGTLIVTLDIKYFPTGLAIAAYLYLASQHYGVRPTKIQAVAGVAAYIACAAIWFLVKFWSFLRESSREDEIRGIVPGQEGSYIRRYASYLYVHILYWPLSIPHMIYTHVLYKLYVLAVNRGSGFFSNMISQRREQLKNQ
jgi:hypothetical protein